MFQSLYAKCEIYIEDVLINSYATRMPLNFGQMTGNIRVITSLNKECAGKNLRIDITPYYSMNADVAGFTYGTRGALAYEVLTANLSRVCVIIFLLTVMLITIGLTLYQMTDKDKFNVPLFANFAFFVFLVQLWILCSSDIPQFFVNSNETVSFISFLSLTIIAIPFMGFCEQAIPMGKRFFFWMQVLGWMIPILNIVGFMFNFFDPPEVLTVSHIYILIAGIGAIFYSLKNRKNGKEAKLMIASVFAVILSACAGIVLFIVAPSQSYASSIVGIGIIIFVLLLFAVILVSQMNYVKDRKRLETYKELAYKDFLTGINNRAAFDKAFTDMDKNHILGTQITLFILDINNLKQVNDTEGHPMGDELIKAVSRCLEETFNGFGECYRLGGDEFAAIVPGVKRTPERYIRELEENIGHYNTEHGINVSVAIGYHSKPWDRSFTFEQDVYRLADQAMYADKQRKHVLIR